MSQCKKYIETDFDLHVMSSEKPVKDLVVTSSPMSMLGYNGGWGGLASSRNLKCIWYLAFNLPYSHLIAGKRTQVLRKLCLES